MKASQILWLKVTTPLFCLMQYFTAFATEINPHFTTTYQIREEGICLSEVAEVLYGHRKYSKEIAEWNQLKPPYQIKVGQTLVLHKPFDRSETRINLAILDFSRRLLNKRDPDIQRTIASNFVHRNDQEEPQQKITLMDPSSEEDIPSSIGIKNSVESSTPDESTILTHGRSLSQHQKYSEVIDIYRTFLNTHPESLLVSVALGDAYLQRSEFKLALPLYQKVRTQDPTNVEVWLKELSTLKSLKNEEKEVLLAREIMIRFPELKTLNTFKKYR